MHQSKKIEQVPLEEEVVIPLNPLKKEDLGLDVEDVSRVKDDPQISYDKHLSLKDISDLIEFSFGKYQKIDKKGRSIKKPREMIPKPISHDFENDFYEILLLGEFEYGGY